MVPITNNSIRRFLGIEITLYFKNGEKSKIGDGLLITDGHKVHICTGKRTEDGKNFLISVDSVKELSIKKLEKATYRNSKNGNFETFSF